MLIPGADGRLEPEFLSEPVPGIDAKINYGPCPCCQTGLVEMHEKVVCPNCHVIVSVCCEGG